MDRRVRRFVWDLDWNLLRTFVVIVQEKGITAAGERMLLKQPTVSNALRRLEEHFGCRLIDRRPGHFEVTPAGQRLFAECQVMFAAVSGLHSLAEDTTAEVTGEIAIALASHVVSPFFDQVLEKLHRRFPLVSFSISVRSSRGVVDSILARDASFGVCLANEHNPRLDFTTLYREEFGYFCGQPHKFFGRSDVTLADLRDEPYVSFHTDQMSDVLWPVALLRQQSGLHGPVVGTATNLEEVRRLISIGCGFGPLPVHVTERDVRDGVLWPLPPHEGRPSVDVYLVTDPAARHSTAETQLLDMLREAITTTPLDQRTYPWRPLPTQAGSALAR